MSESNTFATGAVRSSDANHLSFTSLPLIGLLGVARTSAEGKAKYGSHNYMKGMPVHDLLEHAIRHIVLWLLGDRSEPHLEHAAWNLLAAVQSSILDPELSASHLLGPGATIGPEMQARLDAEAVSLGARRAAGEFAEIGKWSLRDLPEIRRILGQRAGSPANPISVMDVVGPACERSTDEYPAVKAGDTAEDIARRMSHDDPPIRTESAAAAPSPKEDETWIEFKNGSRIYFTDPRAKKPIRSASGEYQRYVNAIIRRHIDEELRRRAEAARIAKGPVPNVAVSPTAKYRKFLIR